MANWFLKLNFTCYGLIVMLGWPVFASLNLLLVFVLLFGLALVFAIFGWFR